MTEKVEMLEMEINAHTHRDELIQLIVSQLADDFDLTYANTCPN